MNNFMIVDDSKISRKIIKDLVCNLGYNVSIEAISGEEALEKYDNSLIDCILMDIEMDGISGIETTRILNEKYPDIKIIIISSVSESARLKEIELSGAKAVLQKPVNVEKLKETISKVL